ncbi:aspartate 4-decarboxylase [Bombilactobacillus thymidiniphilus]|uniref:Aminotransferase n=1 Tax=Bombilactobacillus thymidiniphilus TaxID=2923363 RepID=A0ABY4PEQ8_9LACO|nr:aspartate 4-decarboxylase [Bombilactobacillus thymidiniphilus]UQS84179.1 aspartate 4-decarboxylase [Bombilactobacillus thymidiniphilus]
MSEDQTIEQLSPFELSLYLEQKIKDSKGSELLNAGRGNPNWTAPTPRAAFFLLGQFAVQETLTDSKDLLAKQIKPQNQRLQRFKDFLQAHPSPAATFLHQIITEQQAILGMPVDDWLTAMCDAVIGDNYPAPVRCLAPVEQPLKNYLTKELFASQSLDFDVFPVEGGTAGICYLFDTLLNTKLLQSHDRIALFLPTFAPYLEIPKLPVFNFDVVEIRAHKIQRDNGVSYEYPTTELDKLRDPRVKAAFVVNPSNPTANAMNDQNIAYIQRIVQTDRSDLMLVTDDVYGTFVPKFKSLFAALPYNTVCLYSFSKYFGATGWRVGAIAVNQENVFDELMLKLPTALVQELQQRYEAISSEQELHFIDLLVADSRDIALNHAAGLSTVAQAMIALFSLYGVLDEGREYKKEVMNICHTREKLLFDTLGIKQPLPTWDTAYYCDIDLAKWIAGRYGQDFRQYVTDKWTPTQLLVKLAETEHVMLLKTSPFGSDTWSVRISLANLATQQYKQIGQRLIHLLDSMYTEWEKQQQK